MYKLMVVDDEPIIRDGIINFIVNNQMGFEVVGEAASGKEALEKLLELMPDVIITDICMPLLNGIEFIEHSKSINPDLKVVIVSGYDDFDYAQKALRLGVDDYILKPVQSEKLISTLLKVKEELDRCSNILHDVDVLKKRVEISLPVMKDRFFNELITGKIEPGVLEQKLNYLDLEISGQLYAVALIKVTNAGSFKQDATTAEGMLQCYMMQAAESVFNQSFKPYCFFRSNEKMIIIITAQDNDRQSVFISLNQNLKRIIIAIERDLNINACAALGRLYEDLMMMSQSYAEAEEAIWFNFQQEKASVINYEDINIRREYQCTRPFELERQLLAQVKLGEKQNAQQTVAKILEYYQEFKDYKPSRFQQMVFEIAILILRTVEETGGMIPNTTQDEMVTPYETIHQCETFADLQHFLFEFTSQCITAIEKVRAGKGYTVVEKAKEIIEGLLDDSELSMDDIAARLYISPNYLRSLFKQQVGESFVEYLTRIRMEKAVRLMEDVTLKVHQIAEMVGYIDQRYFSICFKKYYGLTPTEYREVKKMAK